MVIGVIRSLWKQAALALIGAVITMYYNLDNPDILYENPLVTLIPGNVGQLEAARHI